MLRYKQIYVTFGSSRHNVKANATICETLGVILFREKSQFPVRRETQSTTILRQKFRINEL